MKRFALKRITALVLALVMTLSLLPMTAWATEGTGEGGNEGGENDTPAVEETTEYKPLYFYDGSNYHESFTAYNISETYGFRLTTAKSEDAVVSISNGYENSNLSTEGNVGAFTCTDVDCKWSPASATDVEGYLRVEKDNTVYRLKVTVNNGRNVFTYQGVDIYTSYDDGVLGYGDWNYNALSLDINGGHGVSAYVPYVIGAETAIAYLKPAAELTLDLPEGRKDYTTLSEADNTGVYVLTSNDLSRNTSVEVYNGEQCVGEIDLLFVPRDGSSEGDQGGGDSDNGGGQMRIEYPFGQYSKVVMDVDPNVAKIVTFPDEINENNEIVLTVNNVDAELWRPLLDGQDQDFWIHYEIWPIVPEGETADPLIVSGWDANDPKLNNLDSFVDYKTADDPIYMDAAEFAWSSVAQGGVTTIIPHEESYRSWGIRWKYGDNDPTPAEVVVVKVVVAEDVDVIALKETTYPAVAADRIELVAHSNLNSVLKFDEYDTSGETPFFAYKDGLAGELTYAYVGAAIEEDATITVDEDVKAKAANDADEGDEIRWDGVRPYYPILRVKAPTGYEASHIKNPYFEWSPAGGVYINLEYHWEGTGKSQTFTLTWTDANTSDEDDLPEIVEQVTIVVPKVGDVEPWMAHAIINGVDIPASPVASNRIAYTPLGTACGVISHEYEDGILFTEFDSDVQLNVNPILNATVTVKAPEGAVSYQVCHGGDGTTDASYNDFNAWKSSFFWGHAEGDQEHYLNGADGMYDFSIAALIKQEIGDIEYYFSADKHTRYVLIKWNFAEGEPLYEYMQLDTSNYFCEWDTEVVDSEAKLPETGVKKPTVVFGKKDFKLFTRVHPQNKDGQYYFELHAIKNDGSGKPYQRAENDEPFCVYLPYSFMGKDPDGREWTFETVHRHNLEAPTINHYDEDHNIRTDDEDGGRIQGEFTKYGIKFVVKSFSPFMSTGEGINYESAVPFTFENVEFYTKNTDGLSYENWDHYDGLNILNNSIVEVPYTPGTSKTLYLKPIGDAITSVAATGDGFDPLVKTDNIYALTLTNVDGEEHSAQITIRSADEENVVINIHFVESTSDNQGGDNPGGNNDVVLFVNGKRLPEESVENVTYNSQTNTLTLNNATIVGMDDEGTCGAGIFYIYNGSNPTYQTLTIELKGENEVTAGKGNDYLTNAIHVECGNLVIKEADGANGATLNAVSKMGDIVSDGTSGIAVMNGTLTIKGGTVKTYGGAGKTNSVGIFCPGGDCTIEGGEVNAYGRTSGVNSIGVFCPGGNLTINGGMVKAYGAEGAPASAGFAVSGECKILNNSTVIAEGKTASGDNPISAGIFMMPVNDGVSNKVLIDDKASVTVSGKGIAISANEVDIENGNYSLSVKTIENGALTTVTADKIDWSKTVYFKMDQPTQPSGGYPSGYYPVVTPTTPVEKPTEPKPTTPTQPVAPPAEVTVPVSGDENTINVEASVSGSTATIDKVDMTKLEGVIGDDVAVGTVTIDFSDLESSETIDTVEIPSEVVKEIAEAVADPNNDAESLEIVLSDGASIEFDAAALAEKVSQAGGADITISIKQAVENVLSAAQQAAVGDRVAFDINVTSGGVHISDMGGKITIHAPYELRDGETAEGIVVYYVDDEGNKEKCETSYDSVKKRVNWKTDHLSVYMIAHDAPATDDAPAVDNTPADDVVQPDSGNSVGLWIGVALAVLVVAIIVVVILIKRKKA